VIQALLAAVLLGVVLAGPQSAPAAETFRFEASDGTVYYTNAPTDPAYRRMGFSGTRAGWLRIPPAEARSSYAQHIKDAATRYGVPEKLIHAVIRVESAFNTRAVSSKGAQGLMQLMPGTASMLGVRDSFDPGENIHGGVRHLRGLMDRFSNLKLALAAYNAGEQAVNHYRGIPPYPETQGYVAKVLSYVDEDVNVGAASMRVFPTRRVVQSDGTIVYTNIPQR
jgi:soluble lytic murein transglycosylase-like protein